MRCIKSGEMTDLREWNVDSTKLLGVITHV